MTHQERDSIEPRSSWEALKPRRRKTESNSMRLLISPSEARRPDSSSGWWTKIWPLMMSAVKATSTLPIADAFLETTTTSWPCTSPLSLRNSLFLAAQEISASAPNIQLETTQRPWSDFLKNPHHQFDPYPSFYSIFFISLFNIL